MNRATAVALVAVAVLLAWGLMYVGWRRRIARQSSVDAPGVPSPELVERTRREGVEVTYVSTTTAGDWLDRVSAHGLGVRSAARVLVEAGGVAVVRTGAPDVVVPAADLSAVRRETMRAGKAVPGGGLLVWDWALGDTLVSTAVHARHDAGRDALEAAIARLIATGPSAVPVAEEGS